MIRRLRDKLGKPWYTAAEISVGIILFGILSNLAGMWFVHDKASFTRGVWIGVVCGICGTLHMCRTLDIALQLGAKAAAARLVTGNAVRYLSYAVVMGVCIYTEFANPIGVFLGLFGMKLGAYFEPLLHRMMFPGELEREREEAIAYAAELEALEKAVGDAEAVKVKEAQLQEKEEKTIRNLGITDTDTENQHLIQ